MARVGRLRAWGNRYLPAILSCGAGVRGRHGLAALVSVPLGIFIYGRQYASPESRAAMERYYKGIANLNSTAVEFVNGMPVLKIFNQTAHAVMLRVWCKTYTGPYAGLRWVFSKPIRRPIFPS
jgi:hypothetical protein